MVVNHYFHDTAIAALHKEYLQPLSQDPLWEVLGITTDPCSCNEESDEDESSDATASGD